MYYVGLREGLSGGTKPVAYEGNFLSFNFDNKDKDYYHTLFQYDEFQKEKIVQAGYRTAGLKDTSTDHLYFDFDSKTNLDEAREDTLTVVKRLIELGVDTNSILCTFSGKKGFGVYVKLGYRLNNVRFKSIVHGLASDLKTFDPVVADPNRIIRVVNTRHPESKLFKIPLTVEELDTMYIEDIQKLAQTTRKLQVLVPCNTKLPETVKKEERVKGADIPVDWTIKPSFLSNCRFALQNGLFGEGERNSALMILASTYKNLGFDLDHTYRLLKGVCELESRRNGRDRFPDEQLYNNVCTQVYSTTWRGGQYSCKQDGWLKGFCEKLGVNKCSHDESGGVVEISNVFNKVVNFAKNIEKNTIKTGITEIDERMRLITGQHTGILGAPSSGKSSLALQMLESTSMSGVHSIFFSMDMSDIITFLKLSGRVSNKSMEQVITTAKASASEVEGINKLLNTRYANVGFCFRGGLTIDNIREIVLNERKKRDVKLIVIDYATRISGPWSDGNANGIHIANGLRSIANDLGVHVVTLVQPPKSAGDARDELTSMRQIKGSSVFEESFDNILAVYRPGFDSTDSSTDKYLVMPVLKNRMGDLFTLNFRWDGKTGSINSPGFEDETVIKELMHKNRNRKSGGDDGWS